MHHHVVLGTISLDSRTPIVHIQFHTGTRNVITWRASEKKNVNAKKCEKLICSILTYIQIAVGTISLKYLWQR